MRDNQTHIPDNQTKADDYSTMRTLITQERTQKLDLLIHLLGNLQQTIIVLGPKDIGKTTLLNQFQKVCQDRWWIYSQEGSANLSFETIISNLCRFLHLTDTNYGFDLSSLKNFCAQQQVVLIIDDAGDLVPGLISELIDLSNALVGLQLIFSMTYDQFHLKRRTDKIVDDSHVIELPPLNIQECQAFLSHLSLQPGVSLSFKSINDTLVADLYRETHGLPGKIIVEFPHLHRFQKRHTFHKLLKVSGLCVAFGALLWASMGWLIDIQLPNFLTGKAETSTTSINKTTIPIPEVKQLPVTSSNQSDSLPDKIEEKIVANNHTEAEKDLPAVAISVQNPITTTEQVNKAAIETSHNNAVDTNPSVTNDPAKTLSLPTPIKAAVSDQNKTPETEEESLDWIMQQPASNYTLQIMVLSNKNAVKIFMKRYVEFQDSLKYFTIRNDDQEKYVLIYGSFKTADEARQYREVLPKDFQKSLEKRFKAIQNESRH